MRRLTQDDAAELGKMRQAFQVLRECVQRGQLLSGIVAIIQSTGVSREDRFMSRK